MPLLLDESVCFQCVLGEHPADSEIDAFWAIQFSSPCPGDLDDGGTEPENPREWALTHTCWSDGPITDGRGFGPLHARPCWRHMHASCERWLWRVTPVDFVDGPAGALTPVAVNLGGGVCISSLGWWTEPVAVGFVPWPLRLENAPYQLAAVVEEWVEVRLDGRFAANLRRLEGWQKARAWLSDSPGWRRPASLSGPLDGTHGLWSLACEVTRFGLPPGPGVAGALLREHCRERGIEPAADLPRHPKIATLVTSFCFLPDAHDPAAPGAFASDELTAQDFDNQELLDKVRAARAAHRRWWGSIVQLPHFERRGRPPDSLAAPVQRYVETGTPTREELKSEALRLRREEVGGRSLHAWECEAAIHALDVRIARARATSKRKE